MRGDVYPVDILLRMSPLIFRHRPLKLGMADAQVLMPRYCIKVARGFLHEFDFSLLLSGSSDIKRCTAQERVVAEGLILSTVCSTVVGVPVVLVFGTLAAWAGHCMRYMRHDRHVILFCWLAALSSSDIGVLASSGDRTLLTSVISSPPD